MDPIVIIGSGLAGYTLAKELRKIDKAMPIVILTADGGEFYSKPMLSNAYTSGKTAEALVIHSPAQMRANFNLDIRTDARVTRIDPASHTVWVGHHALSYSKLVLAQGAAPVRLPLGGNAAEEVMSINDIGDYARFRSALAGKSRVAILGAGLIGCEFANDLSGAGYAVDVIDIAALPLSRLAPPECGTVMQRCLGRTGTKWHLGSGVESVARSEQGIQLRLTTGTTLDTDVVLSAIGLQPRTQLARDAGILVGRGIVTGRYLETNIESIHALGDCAEVNGLLLPFVMPIMHAARTLAANLAGDMTALRYPAMPVSVKTPACPTIVAPPPAGVHGKWHADVQDDDVYARFIDVFGALRGFTLTGRAAAEKNTLLSHMPMLLE